MPLQPSVAKYKLTVNIFKLETRGWKPRLATEGGCGWAESGRRCRCRQGHYVNHTTATRWRAQSSPFQPAHIHPQLHLPVTLPRRICVVEIINRKKTLSKRRPSRAEAAWALLLPLLWLCPEVVAVAAVGCSCCRPIIIIINWSVGLFLNILNRSLYSTLQLKQKPNKQTNQYNNNKTIQLVFSYFPRLDFVNRGGVM